MKISTATTAALAVTAAASLATALPASAATTLVRSAGMGTCSVTAHVDLVGGTTGWITKLYVYSPQAVIMDRNGSVKVRFARGAWSGDRVLFTGEGTYLSTYGCQGGGAVNLVRGSTWGGSAVSAQGVRWTSVESRLH